MRRSLLLSCALGLLPSCIFSIDATHDLDELQLLHEDVGGGPSPGRIAAENRQRLQTLRPGMSLDEVAASMDQESYREADRGILANPHRRDSFPLSDGRRADVLFFYTDTVHSDGRVTEDELTPVWFVDGVLVGWGRSGFEVWKASALEG